MIPSQIETKRRKPEYLSPTSLALYQQDPLEFYVRYIAPTRSARMPQTRPMSVGSAFDAYIKSFLHSKIFGPNHPEANKYQLDALLESQVEPHNLEWARVNGKYVFDCYVRCGAAADLLLDLEKAVDDPRFEFDLKGTVHGQREGITKNTLGVPLLGKPDLRYINSAGAHVIVDFKVNGYCGNFPISPVPGFLKYRDTWDPFKFKASRGATTHKDCILGLVDGITINTGMYLESYKPDWARQLSTYGWLMGEPVGREIINAVEQIVSHRPASMDNDWKPLLKVASHRIRTSERFQFETFAAYQELWGILSTEPFYFFRNMSFEDSKKKCDQIDDEILKLLNLPQGSDEEWLVKAAREGQW